MEPWSHDGSNGPGNEASDKYSVGASRIANATTYTSLHQIGELPSSWLCLYSSLAWQWWQGIVTTGVQLVIPDPCSTGLGTDNGKISYAGFWGWEWDQQWRHHRLLMLGFWLGWLLCPWLRKMDFVEEQRERNGRLDLVEDHLHLQGFCSGWTSRWIISLIHCDVSNSKASQGGNKSY